LAILVALLILLTISSLLVVVSDVWASAQARRRYEGWNHWPSAGTD
jgi:hypothetical protein